MLDLYKDIIIDHGNNPRNKYIMKDYTHTFNGHNYLCGDSLIIYLKIYENNIKSISFSGAGCVISVASASLMTIVLKNKSIDSSINIFEYFKSIIVSGADINEKFSNLNVLAGVRKFPSRVKCATLIWNTFYGAVNVNK